jgi:hypothetical protein
METVDLPDIGTHADDVDVKLAEVSDHTGRWLFQHLPVAWSRLKAKP